MEDMEDYFGRAVEANREMAASGAAGGKAGEGTDLPWTIKELLGNSRHTDDITAAGEADLSPVGMSTELEMEACGGGAFGILRAVAEENACSMAGRAVPGDGLDRVTLKQVGIINAGERDVGPHGVVKRDGLVKEDRKPLAFEP